MACVESLSKLKTEGAPSDRATHSLGMKPRLPNRDFSFCATDSGEYCEAAGAGRCATRPGASARNLKNLRQRHQHTLIG
jgi:hypothetical protein